MLRPLFALVLAFALLWAYSPVSARPHPIVFVKHHKLLILTSAMFLASDIADTQTTIEAQRIASGFPESVPA
jgi:hypothetical protein